MSRLMLVVLLAFGCLGSSPLIASAQDDEIQEFTIEERIESLIRGSFLDVTCQVPDFQPKVCNMRSTWTPDTNKLIDSFFGDKEAVMSKDSINSPLWGDGTRYKSGTVIFVGPRGTPDQQPVAGMGQELEMVPAFLDVYKSGFVYVKNVPNIPVYASDHKPESLIDPVISYYYVFDENEGQAAAEGLVAELFGELKVPEGFQSSVEKGIQTSGERLFVYRAHPQYITSYDILQHYETDAEGNIRLLVDDNGNPAPRLIGTQPVALPVLDRFVYVALDGDKGLAGMDYFWDANIKPETTSKRCINASEALITAREYLFEMYGGQPPSISVKDIKLCFIQNRRSTSLLEPVWIFDAAYTRQATPEEQATGRMVPYTENLVWIPKPFVVNAITGEPSLL